MDTTSENGLKIIKKCRCRKCKGRLTYKLVNLETRTIKVYCELCGNDVDFVSAYAPERESVTEKKIDVTEKINVNVALKELGF